MPRLPALLVLVACAACGASEAPARALPPRSTDKHALYGDAALVPTREGERVRKEVALAGQIEAATKIALDTPSVVADVELDGPPRVAIAARLRAPVSDRAAMESEVRALAEAIVDGADVHVVLTAPERDAEADVEPARPMGWLLVALLGLGVSMGITIERLRLRAARRRRR